MAEINQEEFASVPPEKLQEKYGLSKEDLDFYSSGKKMLESSGHIGIHKYNSLVALDKANQLFNEVYPHLPKKELSKTERNQIILYETENASLKIEQEAKMKEYMKKVRSPELVEKVTTAGIPLNKETLYKGFLKAFKLFTDNDFVKDEDTIPNLEAVIKYFAKDETFFQCKRLVKNVDGVDLVPSFDKGLLIVGNYGNGKSTIMKCFELMINHNWKIAVQQQWDNLADWSRARFNVANCHELVTTYEGFSTPEEKKAFFDKYSGFRYSFDDLKKEKIASNYGLTNVIQMVIEKRYDNKKITFGTCNYPDDAPNDLSKAIAEFGNKYGGHVYDRVFKMFNIVEFKGKSFRK